MPTASPTAARLRSVTPPPAQPLVVHTPATDEFVGPSGTLARVANGISRRVGRLWRGVTRPSQSTAVEDDFAQLEYVAHADGLPAQLGQQTTAVSPLAISPLATAHGITTVTRFGHHRLATRWAERLTRRQLANGALRDDAGRRPSAYATALAIGAWCDTVAWCTVESQSATVERSTVQHSLVAACRWLAERIEPSGRLRIQPSGCRYDVPTPDAVHLALLAPLARAADEMPDVVSPATVRRAVSYYRRTADPFAPSRIAGGHSLATAALWELGHTDDVLQRMFLPSAHQRRSGAVVALPEHKRVLADDVARLARLWFLTGDVDRGNLAMAWLTRRRMSSTVAILARLDAAREQVSANFRHNHRDVHRTIAADDGRMQAVRQWCADIDTGAHIADVGCGGGRYLRQLASEQAALRLTGVDVGDAPVAALPPGVTYRQGQMLDLSAERESYDAAFSVEALEHALLPERAVAELCRLVRPGGRILIIDKDCRRQSLSRHAPWERWFAAAEVAGWLATHCDDVRVTKIPHGTAPVRHGLYLCWTAVRRSAARLRLKSR